MTLREHVRSHTATLLRRLAFQVRQAAVRRDEDSVHDLRVSVRRLRECLRTFKEVFPAAQRKKVRKDLRKLMQSAEHVRSADIALGLLKKAGLDESAPLVREILDERAQHRSALQDALTQLTGHSYTRSWREALEL